MQLRQHIYMGTKAKQTSEVLQLFILCTLSIESVKKYWQIQLEFTSGLHISQYGNLTPLVNFIPLTNRTCLVSDSDEKKEMSSCRYLFSIILRVEKQTTT